jgi:N-methylhydantoinase A/oxoprolinase/acetone carboxylase beta subunit
MSDLVLGLDTGGTYTDGVLLEYDTRKVVATAKTLTTRHDLTVGIVQAIDKLRIEDAAAIKLASISTTLATNSIAEGKGKRVALVLIGYDPDLVDTFKLSEHFATNLYRYFRGGHDLYGHEQEQPDLEGIAAWVRDLAAHDQADAVAISGYFSPLNPEHEEAAYQAIVAATDLPVVMGHQLSTELGSIQRATTATLNASLLVILRDFILAVSQAMAQRGIHAPLMVVRGDGTLMSAEIAARLPVETVHSGPAASAIGGRFLSGVERAVVIDIGGTTTDIAVVDGGQVTLSQQGATVGGFRTAVKAANLRSIGLGGDSQISLDIENRLSVGPTRVVPLAYMAAQHPAVKKAILALESKRALALSLKDLEYWFLEREPAEGGRYRGSQAQEVLSLLRRGPRSLSEVLEHLGLFHPVQMTTSGLIKEDIVGRAGLTPTDLLHVNGLYTAWDVEAAQAATNLVCRLMGVEVEEFIRRVMEWMTEKIVAEVVTFLNGKRLGPRRQSLNEDLGRWFFDNSLYPSHPYLRTEMMLIPPIIGIGAPAHIFLEDAARALRTELILPSHYAVANAVGAVSGSVVITREALIYPHLLDLNLVGYYVQAGEKRVRFEALDEARTYARQVTGEWAMSQALLTGAVEPHLLVEELNEGPDTYRIRTKAIGNPRLAGGAT